MTGTPRAGSLSERTARAAKWRFAGTAASAIAQFSVGIVLARTLTPADFGLMALASVVLGLVRPLGDLGVGGAVIQRATVTDRHIRSAFTVSVLLGTVVMLAIAAAAPLAARVMDDPRVVNVLRVQSAAFVLQGIGIVAGALQRRRLDFKRQAAIETASYVIGYGVVAIALAFRGEGVWSLVWGSLCQTAMISVLQLIAAPHSVRPLLGRQELHDLLGFGLGASASGWINYLALNGDNFVVGRWLGATSLGLYNRAYLLMNLPFTYGANVASGVLFPAFAQAQKDQARLRRAYLLVTELTAMIAGPAMAALAVAAPHVVPTLYGSKWSGAVAPLQILCLAGYFRALYHLGGIVATSVGWVYRELWRQIVYALLVLIGAYIGSHYGLTGVAVGVVIAILYMFVASGQLAMRATGTDWRTYLSVQVRAAGVAIVVGLVALAVRLLLEAEHAPNTLTTIVIGISVAVPWGWGLVRTLGEPGFEPIRSHLPRAIGRLVTPRTATPTEPNSVGTIA